MAYYSENPYNYVINEDHPLSARMTVWNTDGSYRGYVTSPIELTWYDRYREIPTLEATVSTLAAGHNALRAPCYVAFELFRGKDINGNAVWDWVEGRNSRFMCTKVDWDRQSVNGTLKISMTGLISLFQNSVVGEKNLDSAGKRVFRDMTPGAIIRTLFAEAQAVGELPGLDTSFTNTTDTLGESFGTVTRAYEASTTLYAVLSDLAELGMIEFWMDRHVLCIGGVGRWDAKFLGDGNRPYLKDIIIPSTPDQEAWTDIISRLVIKGEGEYRYVATNPNADTTFGGRTTYISASGIDNDADAKRLADLTFLEKSGTRKSFSLEWDYANERLTVDAPIRTFFPGDYIYTDSSDAKKVKRIVQDCSITYKTGGSGSYLSFTTTVGLVKDALALRTADRVNAMSRNTVSTAAGPAEDVQFQTHPTYTAKGIKATYKSGIQSYNSAGRVSLSMDKDNGNFTVGWRRSVDGSGSGSQPGVPLKGTADEAIFVNGETGNGRFTGEFRTGQYPVGPFVRMYDNGRANGPDGKDAIIEFVPHRYASGTDDEPTKGAYGVASIYTKGPSSAGVPSAGNLCLLGGTNEHHGSTIPMINLMEGTGNANGTVAIRSLWAGAATKTNNYRPAPTNGSYATDNAWVNVGSCQGGGPYSDNYYKGVEIAASTYTSGRNVSRIGVCDGHIYFKPGGSKYLYMDIPTTTTTGSALRAIGANNQICTVSSLSRNKLEQQPVSTKAAEAVLELEPITWVDRNARENDKDYSERSVGFTAEKTEEISQRHDDVLEPVIVRDDDGELRSLMYDVLPDPYSVVLFRQMRDKIEVLESRISELEE